MKSKRIVIIGAGPGGFYAALELLKRFPGQVDIIDRLPTPFGLVRYGIAPDNQRMKSVAKVFADLVGQYSNLRFLGNVRFGVDLNRDELLRHYDSVIYATGAADRQYLHVPGESLSGSFSAMDFVDWYNGNPLRRIREFTLDFSRAAVIGGGNVALDVVRMLINEMTVVQSTDVPDDVLRVFEDNAVRDVYLIIRKGPAQAKFTPVELRGLSKLENVDIIIDPKDLGLTKEEMDYLDSDQQCRTNFGILKAIAGRPIVGHPKRIFIKFWRSVTLIEGEERVQGLRLRGNKALHNDNVEKIDVDAVFSAIGNVVGVIPDVPFDEDKMIIPNIEGQLVDDEGRLLPKEFVTGWAKRGPSGTVGTNRQDSADTVTTLLQTWKNNNDPDANQAKADITELLAHKNVRFTTWNDWVSIDTAEILAGEAQNRPRVKLPNLSDMMDCLD